MLEEIVKKIKTLPPLPKSIQEINAIYSSDDPNVPDVAKAVEKDPMLVANLLKNANSPLYGLSREVTSVLQAVSLFGLSTTRALCMSISAKQLLKIDIEPYGVTPEEFGDISNMQGSLASAWYSKINPAKKDFLFLSALMQEVGKIFIADEIVKNNETTQFKSEISTAFSIEQVEKTFTGVVTPQVTAAIFEHWGFEQAMIDTIQESCNALNSGTSNTEAIALFIIKKAVPINSPLTERSINMAINMLEKTNFDVEAFKNAVEKVKEANH